MRGRRLLLAAIAAAILLLQAGVAFAVIAYDHGTAQPVAPSSIQLRANDGTVYKANDCTGCHSMAAAVNNNNHGVFLRPVTSTVDAASYNPGLADLATLTTLTPDFTLPQVRWLIGGLAIGAERYIYDSTGTVAPFLYPRIGNVQWQMDADYGASMIRTGDPAPPAGGYQRWIAYAGFGASGPTPNNYFTGTGNAIETSADYGCIRCHAYRPTSTVTTATGETTGTYGIDDFGITCASCHAMWQLAGTENDTGRRNIAHPPGAPIAGTLGTGRLYTGSSCNMCHKRSPAQANAEEGVPGRPQQLAQRVWDTGQSAQHRDQGSEVDKTETEEDTPTFLPGVETSGGAGHPNSFADAAGRGQTCLRCHSTEGYIAHKTEATEVPYSWESSTFSDILEVQVRTVSATATLHGVSCPACHTTHGSQQGPGQFGMREANRFEQCADCHREQNIANLTNTTPHSFSETQSRISHPQREFFLGYGGHGVPFDPSPHAGAGVVCQDCHMPVTVGQPEGDHSHLFRIIMPRSLLATVGQTVYSAAQDRASSVVTRDEGQSLRDDSCTGVRGGGVCHAATVPNRELLQSVIETRQQTIHDRLLQAQARLDATPEQSATTTWLRARTNVRIVQQDASWGFHNYDYGIALLDWVLANVQQAVLPTTTLTLSASTTMPAVGSDVTFTASLTTTAGPLAGQGITLQRRIAGDTWEFVTTMTPTGNGYQAVIAAIGGTNDYRALFPGTALHASSFSNTVTLAAQGSALTPTALTLSASNTSPTVSSNVTFTASLTTSSGPLAGQGVTLQRQIAGDTWEFVTTMTPTGNGYQAVITAIGGTNVYRALFPGTSVYGSSLSNSVTLTAAGSALTPTTLVLGVSSTTPTTGATVTFSASLSTSAGPLPGQSVTLQRQTGPDTWEFVAAMTPTGNSYIAQITALAGGNTYRALFPGTAQYASSFSNHVVVTGQVPTERTATAIRWRVTTARPRYLQRIYFFADLREVTAARTALEGRTIYLQRLVGSTWTTVTALLPRDGPSQVLPDDYYTGVNSPACTSRWRLFFAGDATHLPSTSSVITVLARGALGVPVVPSVWRRGVAVTAWGSLTPKGPSNSRDVRLFFQHYERGRWVARFSVYSTNRNAPTRSYTRYEARLSTRVTGRWRVRAQYVGTCGQRYFYTGFRYFTVR